MNNTEKVSAEIRRIPIAGSEITKGQVNKQPSFHRLVLQPPRLILITGVAASGKTTLIKGLYVDEKKIAPGLLDFLEVDLISKDAMVDRITNTNDLDSLAYARFLAYQQISSEVEKSLADQKTTLVDAAFRLEAGTPQWERFYKKMAQKYGAILKIIRLVATNQTLWQRFQRRKLPYDKDKLSKKGFDLWRKREPIAVPMPKTSLVIENNEGVKNFRLVVKKTLAFIQKT